MPPLRERGDDILTLADAFLEEIGRSVGRPSAGIADEACAQLAAYAWPGNVRELRNVIERAVILSEGGLITSEHLPIDVARRAQEPTEQASRVGEPAAQAQRVGEPMTEVRPPDGATAVISTVDAAERELIVQALARAGQNKSQAARLLGLTRAQLRSRLEKHRL
jgi:DNA-binding NtrC family response regulator